MYNHAPKDYKNPFAVIVAQEGFETIEGQPEDTFYQDDQITAFMCNKEWPNNPGNILIVPNVAHENLYDMPDELIAAVHIFSKRVAVAMKEIYGCDGVSVRQHNEPAGNQAVWHYHLHVIPRYENDDLYILYKQGQLADPVERIQYAAKLRDYFTSLSQNVPSVSSG